MSPELIVWKPYKLGEPPPVRFDCPLHVGELLPCRICAAWLHRTQAAGITAGRLGGRRPGTDRSSLSGQDDALSG